MRYERYTTMNIRNIKPNVCHCYSICDQKQRNGCIKEKKCWIQLCYNDKKSIAGVNSEFSYHSKNYDKISEKIDKKVDEWRKAQYKKCKKVVYEITRG